MRCTGLKRFLLAAGFLGTFGVALAAGAGWHGTSGGYDLTWTAADFTALKDDKTVFSVVDYYQKTFLAWAKDAEVSAEDFNREGVIYPASVVPHRSATYEDKMKPVSVVGSMVSFQNENYWDMQPAAHPGGSTDWVALDLHRPTRALSLTQLYPRTVLFKALAAEPEIHHWMANDIDDPPKDLNTLLQRIDGVATTGAGAFDRNMLSHFAFHHIQGNRVAVRIGLASSTGADRYALTQLGIWLPIPAGYQPAFTAAAQGKAGFLMKNAPKGPTILKKRSLSLE